MATNRGPYERNAPPGQAKQPTDADLELDTPANSIKVSSTYDVPKLAEAICTACRAMGELPPLLTIGNSSINQCVKGIAAAFAELSKEGIELSFQPAFRHENRSVLTSSLPPSFSPLIRLLRSQDTSPHCLLPLNLHWPPRTSH